MLFILIIYLGESFKKKTVKKTAGKTEKEEVKNNKETSYQSSEDDKDENEEDFPLFNGLFDNKEKVHLQNGIADESLRQRVLQLLRKNENDV